MNFKDYYLKESIYKEVFSGRTVNNPDITLDHVGKGVDQEGPGLYFSSALEDSKLYGKYVLVANLDLNKTLSSIKKPILREVQYLIKNAPNMEDTLTNYAESERVAFKVASESYMDHDDQKDSYLTLCNDFYRGSSAKYFCINMAKLGYDGIIVQKSSQVKHFIVYNPKKIQLVAFGEM